MCFFIMQSPAPWTKEGKQMAEKMGLTMQVSEAAIIFDVEIKHFH